MRGGRGGVDTVPGIVKGFAAHHYVINFICFTIDRIYGDTRPVIFCIKFSYVKHNAYIRVVERMMNMRTKIDILIDNIKDSYAHIPYTVRHRRAFMIVEREFTGKVTHRFHDMDKLFLYAFAPWLGPRRISDIHCRRAGHHPKYRDAAGKVVYKENMNITDDNIAEMLIDWECARFTKPDKPLDMYGTLIRYYPELISRACGVIRERFRPETRAADPADIIQVMRIGMFR